MVESLCDIGRECKVTSFRCLGGKGLKSSVIHEDLVKAANELSQRLTSAGVPHLIAGGLAVNVHGYERTTRDIDLVVEKKSLPEIRRLIGHVGAQGLPNRKGGHSVYRSIVVDLLYPNRGERALEDALRRPLLVGPVPVADVGPLVYLKLLSSRIKDRADLVELFKRVDFGYDAARRFVQDHAPELLRKLAAVRAEAMKESLEAARWT